MKPNKIEYSISEAEGTGKEVAVRYEQDHISPDIRIEGWGDVARVRFEHIGFLIESLQEIRRLVGEEKDPAKGTLENENENEICLSPMQKLNNAYAILSGIDPDRFTHYSTFMHCKRELEGLIEAERETWETDNPR